MLHLLTTLQVAQPKELSVPVNYPPNRLAKRRIDARPELSLDGARGAGLSTRPTSQNPAGIMGQPLLGNSNMTNSQTFIVTMCIAGLLPLAAAAQSATPPRITSAEAKNHAGETVMVCGRVVDSRTSRYALAGHGKPVTFYLDQPEPHPVFSFVTFGSESGTNPQEAQAAYQGKRVCVTGKITGAAVPYIMAADRSQIKIQPEDK